MILRAYVGVEGLTDVGGRFYLANATAGARVAPATDEGKGWYSVEMGPIPDATSEDVEPARTVADRDAITKAQLIEMGFDEEEALTIIFLAAII
jgi:hypothetical protein